MTDTLVCVVDEEPQAFHEAAERGFSIRLSFATDESDESTAETAFKSWLASLEHVQFAAYKYDQGAFNRLTTGMTRFSEAYSSDLATSFMDWLARRGQEREQFFSLSDALIARPAAGAPAAEPRTEATLDAHDVVLGAASWIAPVPHRLGLTHILRVKRDATGNDASIIVVPYFEDSDLPNTITPRGPIPTAGGRLLFDYVGGARRCCTTLTKPAATPKTLINAETGFADVSPGAADLYRTLSLFEQRAGSQFTGYFAAAEVDWTRPTNPATADSDSGTLTPPALRQLAWRAVTALATSLDTLLLAVLLPNFERREGKLLAPFIDFLIKHWREFPPDDPTTGLPSRATVRAAIRDGLRSLNFSGVAPDISSLLWACHQPLLPPDNKLPPDDAPWLTHLCFAYVNRRNPQTWSDLQVLADRRGPSSKSPEALTTLSDLLNAELANLSDLVLGERGTESTLLLWLSPRPDINTPSVPRFVCDALKCTDKAYEAALEEFRRLLDVGINGAEAARQSVGSLLADLAVRDALAVNGGNGLACVAEVRSAATDWQFWHRRLGVAAITPPGAPAPPITTVLAALSNPAPDAAEFFADYAGMNNTDQDAILALKTAANEMQAEVLDRIFVPEASRFVPDHAPQPLPFPITIDPDMSDDAGDDSAVDDFSATFSGVALLIHRTFASPLNASDWCYGDLAEVQTPAEAIIADGCIQPLPTTLMDERRELFVSYDGLPFASSAFDNSLPEGDAESTPEAFYLTDSLDFERPPTTPFKPLPSLAYGATFQVAAHVVGRAGSLPFSMQDSKPWIPKRDPDPPGERNIASYRYSRTTAIGRAALVEAGNTRRIGVIPGGLRPLVADYPRLGLVANTGLHLDLFRNRDGTGAIPIPQAIGSATTTMFHDPRLSAAAGTTCEISIELLADPAVTHATGAAIFRARVTAPVGADDLAKLLTLDLTRSSADEVKLSNHLNPAQTVTLGGDSLISGVWLRLRLTTSSAAAATLSIADPAADISGETSASRPIPDNLVLIGSAAPEQKRLWRTPFGQSVDLRVEFPRVGYVDFERWMANPSLRAKAFAGPKAGKAQELLTLLLAAHIERTKDPELAQLLDRLPDPAVSGISLEALRLDGLTEHVAQMDRTEVDVPTIGALLATASFKKDSLETLLEQKEIKTILQCLDRAHGAPMKLQPRDRDAAGNVEFSPDHAVLHLPAGVAVRLTARPFVSETYFTGAPSVIDGRLRQWALGADDERLVFDGAALQVETMVGPLVRDKVPPAWRFSKSEWTDLAKSVGHVPAGSARSYDLVAHAMDQDQNADRWRELGSIDIATQRWRFTGRPIYSWFSPRRVAVAADRAPGVSADNVASLWLDPGKFATYDAFEQEAFYDRDPLDAHVRTSQILPIGTPTKLLTEQWDQPSATMFRHRFTLRSRYAAAMADPNNGLCDAWPTDDNTGEHAWMRVVVLGDRPRITLTRPQLRALIPLTSAVEADTTTTPPVLAILQERPFDFGGLADRVASEIRTGTGYASVPKLGEGEGEKIVLPADTRKELGPDPRLSYTALSAAVAAGAALTPEGPIGLTFDRSVTRAPAFPNSAYVLQPQQLETKDKSTRFVPLAADEHFVSVAVRRYLDPDWLTDDSTDDTGRAATQWPFPTCGWFTLQGTIGELSLRGRADNVTTVKIAWLDADNGSLVVKVARLAVDPTENSEDEPPILELCRIPRAAVSDHGWRVAFLHVPLDPDRASLSVFVVPRQDSSKREAAGTAPVLLGSIEWKVPAAASGSNVFLEIANGVDVRATSASPTTSVNWVRTNKSFEVATVVKAGGPDAVRSIVPGDLSATLGSALKFFDDPDNLKTEAEKDEVWIRSRQATEQFPTHAARHMAVLLSRIDRGLGRPIERPLFAHMLTVRRQDITSTEIEQRSINSRLIEFETPAAILGNVPALNTLPEHLRYAYFDWVALGYQKPPNSATNRNLSFFARLIGNSANLAGLTEIVLRLRSLRSDVSAPERYLRLPRGTLASDKPLAGFYFDLTTTTSELTVAKVVAVDQYGTASAPQDMPLKQQNSKDAPNGTLEAFDPNPGGPQGLLLSIEPGTSAQQALPEVWLEISLLVSETPIAENQAIMPGFRSMVDFNWFFGPADSSGPESAADVTSLRTLPEAQARIISVSPTIPVRRPT